MLDPAWYDAIDRRVSRRRFTGKNLGDDALQALREHCEAFRPESLPVKDTTRVRLLERAPEDLFTGLVGSYGRIEGAPSAGLLVGDADSALEAGYVGEAFVLEATRLGVDTCWIAGFFSHDRADALAGLGSDTHVAAAIPLGVAGDMRTGEKITRAFIKASSRLDEAKLTNGADVATWPAWARTALKAARRAPSGGNAQPCRFRFESGALVLSQKQKPYWTAGMDMGIAMLHVDLGAQREGVTGHWELLDAGGAEAHDVARFNPS